jgi:aspartate racemase
MKTIGLLGGMSWESTLEYYKALNLGIQEKLGGLNSAKIVLHSVDFGPMEALMQKGEWQVIGEQLGDAVVGLERSGADFFLICTNTMHKLAPVIEGRVTIPLLHIADAAGQALQTDNVSRVGLLGTSFTMEQDFYKERLSTGYNIEVLVPEQQDREIVNSVIFEELCRGKITSAAKKEYIRIITLLENQGAQAVLLGCTEIGMLVQPGDVQTRLYDTTPIHAATAVQMALQND